jgi:AAA domain
VGRGCLKFPLIEDNRSHCELFGESGRDPKEKLPDRMPLILCDDGDCSIDDLVSSLREIAAGKSTLARRLATQPATLLITMDHRMSTLFPTENETIEDFARLSARLRAAMGPHVIDILRQDISVVLDFPANTVNWRRWMRF